MTTEKKWIKVRCVGTHLGPCKNPDNCDLPWHYNVKEEKEMDTEKKLREMAEKIVNDVEVARLSDTAYLTVEDLKDKIERALVSVRNSCLEEACIVIRGEGEEGNAGETIQVNEAQELIRDLKTPEGKDG